MTIIPIDKWISGTSPHDHLTEVAARLLLEIRSDPEHACVFVAAIPGWRSATCSKSVR
jgi:hypothetical protein